MNQINKTIHDADGCIALTAIYNDYIEKSVGALAFVLNTLCVLVFLKIIRYQEEDIYKYLISKSIVDCYISLRISLKSVLNCQDCVVEHVYGLKVFYLIFFIYIQYTAELISAMFDIAANFNRYRFLTKRFKIFNKISLKIAILVMTLIGFLFHFYLLIDNKIVSKTKNNGTVTIYSIKNGNLGLGSIILDCAKIIFKDVASLALVIILNTLTLRTVKKTMDKKKLMMQGKTSKLMRKTEKTELRLTLMVVTSSFAVLISHVMNIIILLSKIELIIFDKCFVIVAYFLYWLSYSFYFFIYLYFNLSFKKNLFAFF